ncbi:vacuolar assembly protein VPS39 [Saccharomyces cerevisiae RM11-1a]|uniref:Vacuolar assembly protein VPS39 n=1 Tax=Saccharomyces cerevisiae (strain RM11-1a) TaxID=285006 RepID=B3LGX2_YEAS1|nr:vacuolar assembly protein VPS39 [Saccharomyces cerevisiae RM11-1a]
MLRAQKLHSLKSSDITAILPTEQSQKLVLAKKNGGVEVYSRDGNTLKLFQVYPDLLQNAKNDPLPPVIENFYFANELSTIFAQCKETLILLSTTNLHEYDRIIDRRGINHCWLFERSHKNKEEKNTYLIYSTINTAKMRVLIWEGRTYKNMMEASLSYRKETIRSIYPGETGITLATDLGIYHWPYNKPSLIRIEKTVKNKFPKDMISALTELKEQAEKVIEKKPKKNSHFDAQSFSSMDRMSRKSSMSSLWYRTIRNERGNKIRYTFELDGNDATPMIIDGATKKIFKVELMHNNEEPFLIATDHATFSESNSEFDHMQYLSSNLLMLYNSSTIKFVDYENGFTFLQQKIPEGIKWVKNLSGTYFLVWTSNDEVQLFSYHVDDGSEDDDQESICGDINDPDFYQLWRKVLFYKFFIDSPHSKELCVSDNPEESLDICAMKLRDLTVMWCLRIFDKFQNYMVQLERSRNSRMIRSKCEEMIIKSIFDLFIKFWAPPQLVILKVFPSAISSLVLEITGQEHHCLLKEAEEVKETYDIPPHLLNRWYLPYLTDTRRHLQNLLSKENDDESRITWCYRDREIKQSFDFFLISNHDDVDLNTMLTLIDTVLFKCYLYYNPPMVGPFIRVENHCDSHVIVTELKIRHMFKDLIDFYYKRGNHEEALKFLTDLVDELENDNTDQKQRQKIDHGVKILVIYYLKKLSNPQLDVIFTYTDWLLNRHNDSIKEILSSIFFYDSQACSSRDHLKVYGYIKKFDKLLAIQYLEFAISTFRLEGNKLHTVLIKLYLENLDIPSTRIKLKSLLETTSVYEPRTILKLLNDAIESGSDQLPTNQLNFVKYLKIFPLSKLENHKEAVHILLDEIDDYKAATSYCNDVYQSDSTKGEELLLYLYSKLVSIYDSNRNSKLILNFLQDHGSKLNSAEIYKNLPQDISLYDIGRVVSQLLKKHTSKMDETRLEKALLQVELVATTYKLNERMSSYGVLSDSHKCPICKKVISNFGTDSISWFTREGRNIITHYNCGKVLQERFNAKNEKSSRIKQKTLGEVINELNNK